MWIYSSVLLKLRQQVFWDISLLSQRSGGGVSTSCLLDISWWAVRVLVYHITEWRQIKTIMCREQCPAGRVWRGHQRRTRPQCNLPVRLNAAANCLVDHLVCKPHISPVNVSLIQICVWTLDEKEMLGGKLPGSVLPSALYLIEHDMVSSIKIRCSGV